MPAKILIIEDEEALRENMVDLLTMNGYVVIEAADGREGMLKLRQEMPDAVLCDIAIPDHYIMPLPKLSPMPLSFHQQVRGLSSPNKQPMHTHRLL